MKKITFFFALATILLVVTNVASAATGFPFVADENRANKFEFTTDVVNEDQQAEFADLLNRVFAGYGLNQQFSASTVIEAVRTDSRFKSMACDALGRDQVSFGVYTSDGDLISVVEHRPCHPGERVLVYKVGGVIYAVASLYCGNEFLKGVTLQVVRPAPKPDLVAIRCICRCPPVPFSPVLAKRF